MILRSLATFFLIGILSQLPADCLAENYCKEWTNLENAPISIDAGMIMEKLSKQTFAVSQLETAISDTLNELADRYCTVNKDECPSGKCSILSSCEVVYSPSYKEVEARASSIFSIVRDGNAVAFLRQLERVGMVPRTTRICCTDRRPRTHASCARTSNPKLEAQARKRRAQVNKDCESAEQDGEIHTLLNPSEACVVVPDQTARKSQEQGQKKVGTFEALGRAWNYTLQDFMNTGSHEELHSAWARGDSKTEQGAVAPQLMAKAGQGLGYWGGRLVAYMAALKANVDPNALISEKLGVSLDVADPDVDVMVKDIQAHVAENVPFLRSEQVKYFEKLNKEIDAELLQLKRKKITGKAQSQGGNTFALMAEKAQRAVLRVSDLEEGSGKVLHDKIKKLAKAASLIGRQTPLDAKEVSRRCREALDFHADYKKWLIERSASIVNSSNMPRKEAKPSDAFFMFSEPGTLKTFGIQKLAECTGMPVCTISKTTLLQKHHEGRPFAERLRTEIMRCLGSSLGDSRDARYNYNALILLDDLDQILNGKGPLNPKNYTAPGAAGSGNTYNSSSYQVQVGSDHKLAEIQRERGDFLDLIKNLADPTQTFDEPETQFPVDMAGMHLFISANSIPDELKKKAGDEEAALGSRILMYPVPYPEAAYRQRKGEEKWALIVEELTRIGKNAHENCHDKIKGIVGYDLGVFKKRNERLGIRAMFQFLADFKSFVLEKANNIAAGESVDCKDYLVNRRAAAFRNEYDREINLSLQNYDFSNLVNQELPEMEAELEKAGLSIEAKAKCEALVKKAQDESIPFEDRKASFLAFQRTVEFNRASAAKANDDVIAGFDSHIGGLLKGDPAQLKQWQSLASEIQRKRNLKQPVNRPILLDPEPGADAWLVEQLAEVFHAPFFRYEGGEPIRKTEPAWYKYKCNPKSIRSTYWHGGPSGSVDVQYSDKFGIYAGLSGGKVYIFNGEEADSNFTKPVLVLTEEEFKQKPGEVHNWLEDALKDWRSRGVGNQSQGVILVESETPLETLEALKKVGATSDHQAPGDLDQAVLDLRKLNIVVLPKGKGKKEKGLKESHPGVFTLKLPGVKSDAEVARWADRRVKSLVAEMKKAEFKVELTPQDEADFREIAKRISERPGLTEHETKLEKLDEAAKFFVEQLERRSQNIFDAGRLEGVSIQEVLDRLQ